jgi:hypothetical protein
MTPYMPHYCGIASRIIGARQSSAPAPMASRMQDKQKQIVEWMREVMTRRDISARQWAETAKLGKDTVSRAVRDDYEFVTSNSTLAKLAEAVGESAPGPAAGIPKASVLASILSQMTKALLGTEQDDATTLALAEALRDTLLHLADEPSDADDPKVVNALTRASLKQRKRQDA